MDAVAPSEDRRERQRAHDRRIAGGALRVGLLVLLAKICVAAREVAVAAYYGTSNVVDAYNLAFTVVTWTPIMLAAALSAAIVPALVRLRSEPLRYANFTAEFNGLSLAAAVGITIITGSVGPHLAPLIAGDSALSTKNMTHKMTLEMAPFAGLLLLSSFYAVRLQAEERFLYSFFEAMPALFVTIATIGFAGQLDGAALVGGTVAGGLVQAAALGLMLRWLSTGFGGHRLRPRSAEWRAVIAGLAAMGVGQALMYASLPLDQYVASRSGEGGIAVLGYANRLIGIATSMGTVVLGRALLPVISSTIAAGDDHLAQAQTRRWAAIILGVASAVTVIGVLLAPWGSSLILQRGAFSAADAVAVSHLVQIGLIQLPFYLSGLVAVQWLAANGRYRRIAVIAGLALAAKIMCMLALPYQWGVVAVMISTVIMYAVAFLLQYGSVRNLNA